MLLLAASAALGAMTLVGEARPVEYIAAGALTFVSDWNTAEIAPRDDLLLRQTMLDGHNAARRDAGVPELVWNDELARDAHAYAEDLARVRRFEHSHARGQGENLWMGTATAFAYREMVATWVDEGADYRPGAFPAVSRTPQWSDVGHYTQVIWADTRSVGCATASNGHDDFLVCRYDPPGNVYGQSPTEVPRTLMASLPQATLR